MARTPGSRIFRAAKFSWVRPIFKLNLDCIRAAHCEKLARGLAHVTFADREVLADRNHQADILPSALRQQLHQAHNGLVACDEIVNAL